MNLLTIAYKSLRQRKLASFLTGLSVALGVALMVAVLVLNAVVGKLFSQSGSGYDLIIGPKGSRVQLVLSTIYHMDSPIENLPWRFFREISQHRCVDKAIPVNIGDTTQEGNFPIVGTTPEYFYVPYVPGKNFSMLGEPMPGTWDAVIGSQVASRNGWTIGSKFKMVHSGASDGHVHDELFTVKGILAPTGTPNDRTVYVNIDGFFLLDEHDKPIIEALEREAAFFGEDLAELQERYKDEIAAIEEERASQAAGHEEDGHEHHHHAHALPDLQKEVTSILIVTAGGSDVLRRSNCAMKLSTDLQEGVQAQGVNPVQVMGQVMSNLVGNIRISFLVLTGLIILVSGIGIFVSIYNSMADRKREIAIMRALGARRQTVFSVILLESLLLCLLGGLAGILLGHGMVYVAAPIIESRAGLLIDPLAFDPLELVVIPVMVVMATLVGFLPAMTAYRTDVAEGLNG